MMSFWIITKPQRAQYTVKNWAERNQLNKNHHQQKIPDTW